MTATMIEKLGLEAGKPGVSPDRLLEEGRQCLIKGQMKEARLKFRLALMYNMRLASKIAVYYEEILEKDSGDLNARLALADLHLYLGETDSAISELEEIIDIAPDRSDVYTMLGKLYIKQQDYDMAIRVIEAAFGAGIKDTGLSEMLAGVYVEKGRINDAITLYSNLLLQDAHNKNYLRVLGEMYGREGRITDAAKSFYSMLEEDVSLMNEVTYKLEEMKKKDANNVVIRELMADVFIKSLKPALAAGELDEILRIDQKQLDRVIKKFTQILDRYPDEPVTVKALAKAYTMKGAYSEAVLEYRKLMKYSNQFIQDSIEGFSDILARFPGQVHAHESMGDAYLRLGKTEDALSQYLDVLQLSDTAAKGIIDKCIKLSKENPNIILTHHVLGKAYLLSSNLPLAMEEAEFMLYLDRNYVAAHEIMGDAYMKQGNALKAQMSYAAAMTAEPYNIALHRKNENASLQVIRSDIENLKKRIDEDPWRLGSHLDIAKLYLMLREFDKGIKELQTAVKDAGRAPFAYNLLGSAFMELGRFDFASSQFEKALETLPRELGDLSKSLRFNLGASFEAMGDITRATKEYEGVLSEDVDFAGLQARIRNLTSINPDSLRNKFIAAVIERMGEKNMVGVWGADLRRAEPSHDTLNISFGQSHNDAGFEHFIRGRFKNAFEEFSLAVQLDPKFCSSLNNLAVALLREGELEGAATRLTFAASLDPGSAVLHNNMGVYHYLKKDYDSAIAEFNKALEIDPDLSAVYINLGDVMYMKGSAQNAISLWEKIKVNDPLSPLAARRLSYKTVIM